MAALPIDTSLIAADPDATSGADLRSANGTGVSLAVQSRSNQADVINVTGMRGAA